MDRSMFDELVAAYREDGSGERRARWVEAARSHFTSGERPGVLDALGGEACVVLHGSTTRNVDDDYSDLDFFLFLDDAAATRFDAASTSRFVDVTIEGKPGHLNVTTFAEVESFFERPDFEQVYELQHAVAVFDPGGRFGPICARAGRPMGPALRRAALLHNYLEMRSFHRSADNPMERGDRLATLSSVITAVEYAIRCARVIDGLAYPYCKWLAVAAAACPTGSLLLPAICEILDRIQSDANALRGPEKENRVSSLLREIRATIVARARETGIDEPWLTRWWLFLDDQKRAFDGLRWPGA